MHPKSLSETFLTDPDRGNDLAAVFAIYRFRKILSKVRPWRAIFCCYLTTHTGSLIPAKSPAQSPHPGWFQRAGSPWRGRYRAAQAPLPCEGDGHDAVALAHDRLARGRTFCLHLRALDQRQARAVFHLAAYRAEARFPGPFEPSASGRLPRASCAQPERWHRAACVPSPQGDHSPYQCPRASMVCCAVSTALHTAQWLPSVARVGQWRTRRDRLPACALHSRDFPRRSARSDRVPRRRLRR